MTLIYTIVIAEILLVALAIVFSFLADTTGFDNTFETLTELCKVGAALLPCIAFVYGLLNNPLIKFILNFCGIY